MARVTIEDSMIHCPNIFFLIQLAAKRAHQLQHGAEPKITIYANKQGRIDAPTVIALREIAEGFTDFDNETIPDRDAFGRLSGPEVNRPRNWGTGKTQYTAGSENTEADTPRNVDAGNTALDQGASGEQENNDGTDIL